MPTLLRHKVLDYISEIRKNAKLKVMWKWMKHMNPLT